MKLNILNRAYKSQVMVSKSTHQNIILSICTFFFALGICEIILAYPVYYFFKHGKTSFYHREAPHFFFKTDPVLGYVPETGLRIKAHRQVIKTAPRRKMFYDFETNRYGFRYRDDLTREKPVGEIRIFSLGGSTTAGAASPNKMTYPQQLEDLIGDKKVRVINAGVGGYRSIHLLHYYKHRIREFSPNIITIFSGWNDFGDYNADKWKPRDPKTYSLKSQFEITQNPLSMFAIGHLIAKSYYRFKYYESLEHTSNSEATIKRKIERANDPVWLEEYRTNIQELIDLAKSGGVVPVLIVYPAPEFEDAPLEAIQFSERDLNMAGRWKVVIIILKNIRKAIRELAEENNIPLIDVNKRFEKENSNYKKKFSLFVDWQHLSPKGNTVIAEAMLPSIKNILKDIREK